MLGDFTEKDLLLIRNYMFEQKKEDMKPQKILSFIKESNWIEGEVTSQGIGKVNPGDREAMKYVQSLGEKISLEELCTLHTILGKHLKANWVGKLRTVDVRVGKSIPPTHKKIPHLMELFLNEYPKLDSWLVHTLYEKIHPFQDLNGRVGRILWLHKKDFFYGTNSFLQGYYYETLAHMPLKVPKDLPEDLKKLLI